MSTRTYRQILLLLSLIILILHASAKETNKPGKLGTYCSNDFIAAWGECCGRRYPGCITAALASVQLNKGRKKRSIVEGKRYNTVEPR
jgi:hypothetical protein